MQFKNLTNLPGEILVASTSDREQLAMVASKITYRLNGEGGLDPVDITQMWPVYIEPAIFNGVNFLPELEYRKKGVDLLVFGEAVAPRREQIRRMTVRIECGPVDYRIEVFGDRSWKKSLGRFKMTESQPFQRMPLTNDRAFGGKVLLAGEEAQHGSNPEGRGYCSSKKEVDGKPLPNLEHPDALIRSWKDTPVPACLYKPKGLLLDAKGPGSLEELAKSPDPLDLPRAVATRAFNQTVPGLICPAGQLGRFLRLSGFDANGDVIFPLPPERSIPGEAGPAVHVSIGSLKSRFPLSISTVVALVPRRVLVVTYLGLFRYLFREEEVRTAELRWYGEVPVEPPEIQREGQVATGRSS